VRLFDRLRLQGGCLVRIQFQIIREGVSHCYVGKHLFPAKLAHGHVFDLAEKNVDRIFYPTVVYEQEEYADALNSYNCPVVTGYPDLLKSAVNPEKKFKIPLDKPAVSFKDFGLLKAQLYLFFKQFGINYRTVSEGVEKGVEAQSHYKTKLKSMAKTCFPSRRPRGG